MCFVIYFGNDPANTVGCFGALASHDDLIDGILSSRDGKKFLRLAIASECRTVLGLPEIQSYLNYVAQRVISNQGRDFASSWSTK